MTEKYNEWLQAGIAKTVWAHCTSYYRADGHAGKNIATFPGPATLFWWLASRPRARDYKIMWAEAVGKRPWSGIVKFWASAFLLLAVAGVVQKGGGVL